MKKLIIIMLFALQTSAYAQVSPPGQATPQEIETMAEKQRLDRDEEIARGKREEEQQKQQTQIMQQLLDVQRQQLDIQHQQLDLQQKQFDLEQRQPLKKSTGAN